MRKKVFDKNVYDVVNSATNRAKYTDPRNKNK